MPIDETIYRLPSSRAARRPLLLALLVSAALDLGSALCLATQAFARRWSFSRVLGRPWMLRADYPDWRLLAVALGLGAAVLSLLLMSRRARPLATLALPLLPPLGLAAFEPIYPPLGLLRWATRWRRIAALAPSLSDARSTFQVAAAFGLACTAVSAVAILRRHSPVGDIHGSSHWATPAEVRRTGLLDEEP
jgi:hypothetical protein